MKLITELFEDVEYISEAKENGEKEHYIHGIFLQGDIPNKNNRKYPGHILEKEVNRYMKDVVKQNRAYGELGHPEGPTINLDRVSHIIVDLQKDGSNYIGKAKLTDTPMGNIAKGLLKSGANLGVSSRGMGSLIPVSGIMLVQPDFRLATAADIVADPSAPNAFVKGIMENVEWVYDSAKDSWQQENLHELKKSIRKMSLNEIEQKKFSIFENYLSSLSSKNPIL
jgi:hypothetical protein